MYDHKDMVNVCTLKPFYYNTESRYVRALVSPLPEEREQSGFNRPAGPSN